MTSRKANQARFAGVAAWLFRQRWVAGLLSLFVFAFCSPAWAQIPRCRELERERDQRGRELQPWERGRERALPRQRRQRSGVVWGFLPATCRHAGTSSAVARSGK